MSKRRELQKLKAALDVVANAKASGVVYVDDATPQAIEKACIEQGKNDKLLIVPRKLPTEEWERRAEAFGAQQRQTINERLGQWESSESSHN